MSLVLTLEFSATLEARSSTLEESTHVFMMKFAIVVVITWGALNFWEIRSFIQMWTSKTAQIILALLSMEAKSSREATAIWGGTR